MVKTTFHGNTILLPSFDLQPVGLVLFHDAKLFATRLCNLYYFTLFCFTNEVSSTIPIPFHSVPFI